MEGGALEGSGEVGESRMGGYALIEREEVDRSKWVDRSWVRRQQVDTKLSTCVGRLVEVIR